MNSETLTKTRTHLVCVLLVLFAPLLSTLALIWKLYYLFFGKKICKSIAGEVAVVTGSANGLGKAISIELAKQGCHLAIVDVKYEEALKTANFISENYNVKAKAYKVDITQFQQVVELEEQVNKDLGATTILVNNAGMLLFSELINANDTEVQQMINVNLTSHFWTNRVFLKKMRELNKGHIVAISSMSGFLSLAYNEHYTATKFGVRGLMRSMRQEFIAEKLNNIHLTTIFPYFLSTHTQTLDLFKETGMPLLYPTISGEETAKRTIEAILRNEREVVIPGFMFLFCIFLEFLPAEWLDWISINALMANGKKYKNMVKNVVEKSKQQE